MNRIGLSERSVKLYQQSIFSFVSPIFEDKYLSGQELFVSYCIVDAVAVSKIWM